MAVGFSGVSQGDFSGDGVVGTHTPAASVTAVAVTIGAYPCDGAPSVLDVTYDGNTPDDVIEVGLDDFGYGSIVHCVFLTFTAETANDIDLTDGATFGDGSWAAWDVTGADTTELAATGWPDTDSVTNDTSPSFTLTTATDDGVILNCYAYKSTNDAWEHDAGQTELFDRYESTSDGLTSSSYEIATGASTVVGASTSATTGYGSTAVVYPVSGAGAATEPGEASLLIAL